MVIRSASCLRWLLIFAQKGHRAVGSHFKIPLLTFSRHLCFLLGNGCLDLSHLQFWQLPSTIKKVNAWNILFDYILCKLLPRCIPIKHLAKNSWTTSKISSLNPSHSARYLSGSSSSHQCQALHLASERYDRVRLWTLPMPDKTFMKKWWRSHEVVFIKRVCKRMLPMPENYSWKIHEVVLNYKCFMNFAIKSTNSDFYRGPFNMGSCEQRPC